MTPRTMAPNITVSSQPACSCDRSKARAIQLCMEVNATTAGKPKPPPPVHGASGSAIAAIALLMASSCYPLCKLRRGGLHRKRGSLPRVLPRAAFPTKGVALAGPRHRATVLATVLAALARRRSEHQGAWLSCHRHHSFVAQSGFNAASSDGRPEVRSGRLFCPYDQTVSPQSPASMPICTGRRWP